MTRKLLLTAFALLACLLCSIGAAAAEAYACYTPSNTTLTFYYDNQRSSRTGTTYDLNTGSNWPGWLSDGYSSSVTRVVFNSSFANARPTTTYDWFFDMWNLQSIAGISYLNTSEVTNMSYMFRSCSSLTSLDVSGFNTSKVTNMCHMFSSCASLSSIDVAGFNTSSVEDMSYMFNNCTGLTGLDLSAFDTRNVTKMTGMFRYCRFTSLDLSEFNTSKVTDMSEMFCECSKLTTLNLSGFNTSQVTNMGSMFDFCNSLTTIGVGSSWNTAAVTSSGSMFRDCTQIKGGKGTTYNASITDKTYAHIDGGSTNPGYLTEVLPQAYAVYTPSNTTLSFYYDARRVSRPGTTYDLNAGSPGWYEDGTYSSVTSVVFNPSFVAARPTSTSMWFCMMSNLRSITGMENYLNTSDVTNMSAMFYDCSALTSVDMSNFNTSNVTRMSSMFYYCDGLTSLDLSSFNTENVTSMWAMFNGCSNLTTIYAGSGWNTAAVTQSENMFTRCTSLVGGKGTTYDANHVDAAYAHIDGGPSNPGYLTEVLPQAYAVYTPSNTTLTFYYDTERSTREGTTYDLNTTEVPGWYSDNTCKSITDVVFYPTFSNARPTSCYYWFRGMTNLTSFTGLHYLNTSQVTDMRSMFFACRQLTSLNLRTFNTANVTNMSYMFNDCRGLTSLNLSSFNTANVTDMNTMFYYCAALTSLDLSSFNTANVTDMSKMFASDTKLVKIYVGNGWSTSAVTSSSSMFYSCTSIVGGAGTTYSSRNTNAVYAHIDGGTSNPGYFTDSNDRLMAYAVYTPSNTTLTFYYDNQRSTRTGTTYDLNEGYDLPDWYIDYSYESITQVVFDPSFTEARPTSTCCWFFDMGNLQTITGMEYLNTEDVTIMLSMFYNCQLLTTLDLSGFDTQKVINVLEMFRDCTNLTTIYGGDGWNIDPMSESSNMFLNCFSLVGGKGTTYDANHTNYFYARIDGGPSSPGYFTAKFLLGDVNGDGQVNITDATVLINALLNENFSAVNQNAADLNEDGLVNITDATLLINRLLNSR